MTPELTALTAAVLLQALTLALMAAVANRELGHRVTTGPRDGQMPKVSPLLGRLLRTVTNGFEGLVMFAPAVLVVALSGQSDSVTQAAAWVYVAARLLYVPAYAFGWVPWRSAIWGVGLAATLALLISALI
ncbi:MAG: MAPEG family protein [Rhodobacteraceae bacterium]|nr:MAPEG family protein [Paracoccaceae bacterium]